MTQTEVWERLARTAEELFASLPPPADGAQQDLGWGVLRDSGRPGLDFCIVDRVRLEPEDVVAAVTATRDWFSARGQPQQGWWLGPSARPVDLAERLAATGFLPHPAYTAMVLTSTPHARAVDDSAVEIRAIEDRDGLRHMLEIDAAVWSYPREDMEVVLADLDNRWQHYQAEPWRTVFLAYLDGAACAYGTLVMTDSGAGALLGGSTLVQARGRGLYRALVQARWDAAMSAGADGVVVQASAMSRPVLTGLGFKSVATVEVWASPPVA